MALYLVLHHQLDENQPWINAWLNDGLIEAIQTTNAIGRACQTAKDEAEQVFIHRCGWNEHSPVICCAATVEVVGRVDNTTMMVKFTRPIALSKVTPITPVKGQNFYVV